MMLTYVENISLGKLARSLQSFMMYLPIMIIIYVIVSLIFSQLTLFEVMVEIGWVAVKFLLVMAIMNVYHTGKYLGNVFDALRSIWVRINRPWQKVENFFLFLEITLRFYPSFQRDWNRYNDIQKALGLIKHTTKFQQWKKTANQLPGMFFLHLRNADDIAQSMSLRGYGKHIPRGVAQFISFNSIHLFTILFIITVFSLVHFIAAF
ncbi:MAG: hypothetical protein ACE5D0_00280 [Fidelibacterota bacterium]